MSSCDSTNFVNLEFQQPWSRERTICNPSLTESEKTERRNELVFKNVNKLTKNEKFARAAKGLIKRRSQC